MTAFWEEQADLRDQDPVEVRRRLVEELVAAAKGDPGAAFEPDALDALAVLRSSDAAAFERARERLKAAGVRVTALDAAVDRVAGDGEPDRPSQADRLAKLALARAELFHDADHEAYADVVVDGHRETHRVRSQGFRRWLARAFYEAEGKAPGGQSAQDALNTIEAKGAYDGPQREVFTRVGEHGGAVYLDLGDDRWHAVEITAAGWRVVETPPVRFVRPAGLRPLPMPVVGGSVVTLRPFLNLADGADGADQFKLVVSFIIAALRRRGPFPVLVANGEQGGGKSTLARVIRRLIDPNAAEIRSAPRDERDLVIAARNGWLVALANLSHIPADLADALCRVATGAGFGTRTLYTDTDETLIQVCRPQLVNGIPDLATRPDLADRALVLVLPELPAAKRKPEAEFWAGFEAAAPGILGALLDAVACALRREGEVKLARLPRMADFALWVEAAAPALGWKAGELLRAYEANRAAAVEATVEADPVAVAVRELVEAEGTFEGTATVLLDRLNSRLSDDARRRRDWPKSANALSNRLRRAAPGLRKLGIAVTPGASGGHRFIRIEQAAETSARSSRSSQAEDFCGLRGDDRTKGDRHGSSPGDDPHSRGDDPTRATVTVKPLKGNGVDDRDGGDDNLRTHPNGEEPRTASGQTDPDRCALCGLSDGPGDPLLPYGDADTGHAWLHRGCCASLRENGLDIADLIARVAMQEEGDDAPVF